MGIAVHDVVQIGSTEWVEENLGMLGARAVAYINVDCAVAGPGFFAAATPQLDELVREVTKEVDELDPCDVLSNRSILRPVAAC